MKHKIKIRDLINNNSKLLSVNILIGGIILVVYSVIKRKFSLELYVSLSTFLIALYIFSMEYWPSLYKRINKQKLNTFNILGITIVNFVFGITICSFLVANSIKLDISVLIPFIFIITFLLLNFNSRNKSSNTKIIDIIPILCIILNIINTFAIIYSIVYISDKSSFSGIDFKTPFTIFFDFFYFSTVTFTTLGYGDITPHSIIAKAIVIIEALTLSVFISIIIFNIINARNNQIETEKPC